MSCNTRPPQYMASIRMPPASAGSGWATKATSTCRMVASSRTSSSNTEPPRDADTPSATARKVSSVRARSISAAARAATTVSIACTCPASAAAIGCRSIATSIPSAWPALSVRGSVATAFIGSGAKNDSAAGRASALAGKSKLGRICPSRQTASVRSRSPPG